ncbi:HAMP domain-containing sensor histidine kinase [Kitasatospora paracochleata]|uniref:histidine kinase n=1 Tax=Kitasatospora paracochleata TaxID=58354 RepID=A0ABT1IW38_9ACTN|nr:HAMP domain-containing sensor histidine kinase [Kitasatospora paracochleata]MCP2309106.1 two-component system sensor histidine kinase BaeS [Kitasatospora paracochleata]
MSRRPPGTPRRRPLRRSIALVTTAVAALAVLLTGLVAWRMAGATAEAQEREQLGRHVEVLSRVPALSGLLHTGEQLLNGRNGVQLAVIAPNGAATGPAGPAVGVDQARDLLAGRDVSSTALLGGQQVILVGRPARGGGAVVLTEPYTAVDRARDRMRHGLLLPLGVGMAGAAIAGALLARRIARPLASAAATAHRLAAGERGLRCAPDGPAEAAEVAAALNRLDEALARSENRQREFLLSVSHELRTPLTALQGYAEALADGVVTAEEAPEVGRVLQSETRRLERFLGDLLDLARLEADDFRLERAPTDLTALVADAAALWAPRCARHGVELTVEAPAGAVPVDTDGFRVRQLIDGLLENALRVAPAGRPLVLALTAGPDRAELQVRDSGPGLTEEDLAVAFERGTLHARYRETRPVGSGLGLAIAHRLAGRLGGRITASAAPEGGACFTVALPIG